MQNTRHLLAPRAAPSVVCVVCTDAGRCSALSGVRDIQARENSDGLADECYFDAAVGDTRIYTVLHTLSTRHHEPDPVEPYEGHFDEPFSDGTHLYRPQ